MTSKTTPEAATCAAANPG